MDVAIGLPNAVPGTTGGQLTEWARRSEARGFSSLGRSTESPRWRRPSPDYYAWLGEETASWIADSAAKDPETVRQYCSAFESAGCQELFLFPSSSDPQQVDLLADALGM